MYQSATTLRSKVVFLNYVAGLRKFLYCKKYLHFPVNKQDFMLICKNNFSKYSSLISSKKFSTDNYNDNSKNQCEKKVQEVQQSSGMPSGDPPLLLSVRRNKINKYVKKQTESSQNVELSSAQASKIPSELMLLYNAWLKNKNSVDIIWDSYFRHMLLWSLYVQEDDHPSPPAAISPSKLASKINKHEQQSKSLIQKKVCPWSIDEARKIYPQFEEIADASMAIRSIILSYQLRGHLVANLDPLGIAEKAVTKSLEERHYMPPEIVARKIDIVPASMDCVFKLPYFSFIGGKETSLTQREIIRRMEKVYCQHIGVEFTNLAKLEKNQYIREKFETPGAGELSSDLKKKILKNLTSAVCFEKFLVNKWPREKKFGLEGGESLIPAMRQIIDRASCAGTQSFIIGMAHRGRLNVLANVCHQPLHDIFSQFSSLEIAYGSGDVKYHLGAHVKQVNEESGKEIDVTIMSNPSHLEIVSPIVIGRVRSEQFFANDKDGIKVMAILVHGDAAFAGQGICYETVHLSKLPNYTINGTIHIVVNNQIGFTTDPRFSRSSIYCTDVGNVTRSPIFHVNGDDPEAVIHCCNVALDFRNKFHRAVVIDIVCYRRYGHNETDDPRYTQPLMYKKIDKLPNIFELYSKKLIEENVITDNEAKQMFNEYLETCEKEFTLSQGEKQMSLTHWVDKSWDSFFETQDPNKIPCTGVKEKILKQVGIVVSSPPPSELKFELHKEIEKILAKRMDLLKDLKVDWTLAEAMAFGSLLLEGYHVRMSGEDVERGTFGNRHSVYHHQSVDKEVYFPLQHLSDKQGDCTICNSSLSEYAILGFELGYSMTNPNILVLWEAQFGDFLNTAQTVVDTYISSGEAKWGRQMGLVLLLPHGLEGAGPEHSSARVERFLQMCNDDPDEMPCLNGEESLVKQLKAVNWIVACPSTPANYFHILRRQMKMPFRKPLILFTPKLLIRTNLLQSSLSDMTEGTELKRVIPENGPASKNSEIVKRLIFCTGRVYYNLIKERDERKLQEHIAITRIEQLCPFPYDLVRDETAKYPNAEICWTQEEHKNSGAWSYIFPRFSTALQDCEREVLVYVGRATAAAPATGNSVTYKRELKQLINDALDLSSSTNSSNTGTFWTS